METTPITLLTPFAAAIHGKDADGQGRFWQRLGKQPLPVREFVTSPETAKALDKLVKQGIIPESHGIAVARLIALIALNEVDASQSAQLLERIGIPDSSAAAEALRKEVLVRLDEAHERVRKYPGLAHPETTIPKSSVLPKLVPPLTVRAPAAGPMGKPPAIIDLRKQP